MQYFINLLIYMYKKLTYPDLTRQTGLVQQIYTNIHPTLCLKSPTSRVFNKLTEKEYQPNVT